MSWTKMLTKCRHKFWANGLLPQRMMSSSTPDDLPDEVQEAALSQIEPKRTKINPDKTSVLLFSGQGSQKVGMAATLTEYPNVKEMFSVASEILNFDLYGYCQDGPQSELDRTVHCQPAVFVTALAAVEKLQVEAPEVLEHCVACAGYSVGEFAALVFSGALTFEDAVKLIKVRSVAMQNACNSVQSSMVTGFGGRDTQFRLACKDARAYAIEQHLVEDAVCCVSANLAPNLVTLAGHKVAIDYIASNRRKYNIKKLSPIPVSGAFHSHLMEPVRDNLKEAMKHINIEKPLVHVYSNLTGKKYHGPEDIRKKLPLQVSSPVQWEQTMHDIFSRSANKNMPHVYEAGPGQQLGSFLNKCNGKAFKNYLPLNPLVDL